MTKKSNENNDTKAPTTSAPVKKLIASFDGFRGDTTGFCNNAPSDDC
jgi:hypothetical protein